MLRDLIHYTFLIFLITHKLEFRFWPRLHVVLPLCEIPKSSFWSQLSNITAKLPTFWLYTSINGLSYGVGRKLRNWTSLCFGLFFSASCTIRWCHQKNKIVDKNLSRLLIRVFFALGVCVREIFAWTRESKKRFHTDVNFNKILVAYTTKKRTLVRCWIACTVIYLG